MGKKSQGVIWIVNSIPKHKVPSRVVFKARLQLSLAENVFCQGMVVLLKGHYHDVAHART